MAAQGLDALWLCSEAEVRYFTGFLTQFWQSPTRPWFVVVPGAGKPIAVIPEIGAACMGRTWVEDIRTWSSPDLQDDGVSLLAETLREVARKGGNIGLPMGHETHLRMPLADYERLRVLLGDMEFRDATAIVRSLRMVKSEAEIAKIAYACQLVSNAFEQAGTLFHVGQSEQRASCPIRLPIAMPLPRRAGRRTLRRSSGAISVAVHLLIALVVLFPVLGTRQQPLEVNPTVVPLFTPIALELPPMDDISGGGGGGGLETEEPPVLGEIPEAAEEQFVPPSVEPTPNRNPVLVMAPTVVAPQLADPDRVVDLAMLGAPDGIPGPPSAGPGTGGGIGTGRGTGVGEGRGTGVGEGEGTGVLSRLLMMSVDKLDEVSIG